MSGEVDAAVGVLAREHGGRVTAALARRFGDLDLADDAVQEALVEACEHWPSAGLPGNPVGWLSTVATRKAVDRLRRAESARRRLLAAAPDLVPAASPGPEGGDGPEVEPLLADDDGSFPDERLRLLLLCCHPAVNLEAQVALTLRLVGGLSTAEVAAGLLLPESTVAQRIVRAKRKIRDARIPLSMPADLSERLDAVLQVLYLVFNEGYLRRAGAGALRVDLMAEATRLTEVLAGLVPEEPEVLGLLALQHYVGARSAARVDADGELVLLAEQDRSRWDVAGIRRGDIALAAALRRCRPGRVQLEALVAAEHAHAREAADTDWPVIAGLYGRLLAMTGSPVVALNRAVAVALADGPDAGLALLAEVHGLDGYHLLLAARGEMLLAAGRPAEAVVALETALGLVRNEAERRHLQRRVAVGRRRPDPVTPRPA